jgi:hypothetical protein
MVTSQAWVEFRSKERGLKSKQAPLKGIEASQPSR